jgi:hypothetical protein
MQWFSCQSWQRHVWIVIVSLFVCACGAAALPKEAETTALELADQTYLNDIAHVIASSTNVNAGSYFYNVVINGHEGKTAQSKVASLTDAEKFNGLSDAWCVVVEIKAGGGYTDYNRRYAMLTLKNLNAWVSKKLSRDETAQRCGDVGIVQ